MILLFVICFRKLQQVVIDAYRKRNRIYGRNRIAFNNPKNYKMKKRIVFAVFACMVLGLSLSSCRSKELCPAYTDSQPTIEAAAEHA